MTIAAALATMVVVSAHVPPKHVVVVDSSIDVLDPITFVRGTDQLSPGSLRTIAAVAQTMIGNPNILMMDVQSDAAPEDALLPSARKALSLRRARKVMAILVGDGVSASRLEAHDASDDPAGVHFIIDRRAE